MPFRTELNLLKETIEDIQENYTISGYLLSQIIVTASPRLLINTCRL